MEAPDYVYWMPRHEPSFVLQSRHYFQKATVIKAVRGQELDQDFYFWLLTDRVQYLIGRNDDPEDAKEYTFNVLEKVGLISYEAANCPVEEAGQRFVFDNLLLREHLYEAGVFYNMPKILSENDPEAEEMFYETDLEGWFSGVTAIPSS